MEKIRVTPEELRQAARKVDMLADEYKSKYVELFATVDEFTQTDFRGKEADEFRNKVRDFEDDFTKMKNLMNEYANHLRKAADDYDSNADNLSSQISSLQS